MKNATGQTWIVCRICLQTPKNAENMMHTIFDHDAEKDLTKLIMECGGVPIKQFDHFPDKICARCLKFLQVAHRFRVTCQRSHQQLGRLLAPIEVEQHLEDDFDDFSDENEDTAEVGLKVEPDSIKQEYVLDENDDSADGGVMEIYEPIEVLADEDEINDEELDAIILDGETEAHTAAAASEESVAFIEYLDDIADDFSTSDEGEDDIPLSAKVKLSNKKKLKEEAGPSAKETKPKSPLKRAPRAKKPKPSSYICDMCGNTYPSQGRLTEHIKLHKGIKPHECEICGHAFAQTQQLTRHMNTHTGNRPYKCTYCNAAFADLSTRNKHHRIHTNERPYVCDVCGKAFTYTNTLKFHKMIHTGEKPFVCEICGKGFQQMYKLRNHKMTHARKGIKLESIEVETISNYEEVAAATGQILEI